MTGLVSLFYSDVVADFAAPTGLATLVKFPAVVLQAEMWTATADSTGRQYAGGVTPAAGLASVGVTPWAYLNPFWVMDSAKYGGPGEMFRKAQAAQVEACDAWLRTALNGGRVPVYGGRMWAVDVRNLAYRDWLIEAALPERLFVDCGFYHAAAYHKWTGGPDTDRAAVIADVYSHWRAMGRRLVVNAGWERVDPDAGKPVYPFAGCVDGVAIEVPGGQGGPNGWRDIVSYRNVTGKPSLARVERVISDWLQMGKAVWLLCVWQRNKPEVYTYSPFPTFEEHADFWLDVGQRLGCSVAVYQDTSHAVWRENWAAEWGVTADGGPLTTVQRLEDLERRVSRLEGLRG